VNVSPWHATLLGMNRKVSQGNSDSQSEKPLALDKGTTKQLNEFLLKKNIIFMLASQQQLARVASRI
jgi:hypothetical protein